MSSPAVSLRRWLNRGVGLLLAALAALGIALAGVTLQRALDRVHLDRLQHDLDGLTADAEFVDGRLGLGVERLAPIYQQPYSGHYYCLSGAGQELRSRSLWDTDLDLPRLAPGERWQGRQPGPEGQRLLVLAQGVRVGDQAVVIAAAEDMSAADRTLARVAVGSVAFGAVALILILLAQSALVRRGLRPLERLTGELKRLEQGELAMLSEGEVPAEVLPLVRRLNGALAQLGARLERSRKAAGNLAHALKTPLTVLTQLADDLPEPTQRERLREQTDAMTGIVARELKRARLAGGALPGRGFDLARELEGLLATLRAIHRDKAVRVDASIAPDARFAGDREDFLELMGVVLDNAFKWAAGRVSLRVTQAERLLITVSDDGPGVAPDALERLQRRGERLDESLPGAGLGLAIADDIVKQYGGGMRLARAISGGLEITLTLPAIPPP